MIRITGIRDGLLVIGSALLLCAFLIGAFAVANKYDNNVLWVCFAWSSVLMIPLLLRGFRAHLKRPHFIRFLAVLVIVHGIVCTSLIKWRIPLVYWFPIFIVELSLGAWVAYRLFGVIPSGDI